MKYFKREEFVCPCCGVEDMQETFLTMLDLSREQADVPFRITSGYRCRKHNTEIGGATHSAHVTGHAVDIACSSTAHRYKIVKTLLSNGFNRVGVSAHFIHVDNDPALPCNVMWTY
jgi:zinc D-Ala-D-Ala carboxypeptidase